MVFNEIQTKGDDDYALYSRALDDIFSGGGEPVGRVKTIGGYPDGSEHTVEWLVKHKDIQDGDLLYTSPQPAEPVGWKSNVCNCNQGQVCQVCDPTDAPVKMPSGDDLIDLASQHSLVFRTHYGDVLSPWKEDVDIGEYLISYSRALLTHYGHPTTPEGWQLVPKEPTEKMIDGVRQFFSFDDTAEVVYKNMLKTAPKFGEGNGN